MSLYRQAGGRAWTALVAALVAGVVIGGVAGYLVGKDSEDEPTLADQVAVLQTRAQPLQLAAQQVKIEYGGTVEDGKVVSPTEYQAASATVERAIATFEELQPDLSAVDPSGAAQLDRELHSLNQLVESRAPQSAVDEQAAATAEALAATPAAPSEPPAG